MGKHLDRLTQKYYEEQQWVEENKPHVDALLDRVESFPKDSDDYKSAVAQLDQEGYLGDKEDGIMNGILKWFS